MKNRKLKNQELKRKSKKEFLKSKKTPLILILDDIRSGHNVGSILRTADAFLLSKVYINLIDQKEPTLNFNTESGDDKNHKHNQVLYYKKIIKPSDKEKISHSQYLKTNLKKNFF